MASVDRGLGRCAWLSALVLGAMWLSAPPTLHAQDDGDYAEVRGSNAETARAMYERGLGLAEQGKHREAADLFERLLDTRWSMQIAYNHASALVHLGELVRASEILQKVIREAQADPTGSPASEQMRFIAETLLEEVSPRLGRLTIEVEGDARDVAAEVDGVRRIFTPGEPLAVDPGRHSVNLQRGSSQTEAKEIILGDDLPLAMTITLDASGLDPVGAGKQVLRVEAPAQDRGDAVERSLVDSPEDDDNLLHQWWFWGGGAAVVVGAVVIVALASGSDDVAGPPSTDSGVVVTALEMP